MRVNSSPASSPRTARTSVVLLRSMTTSAARCSKRCAWVTASSRRSESRKRLGRPVWGSCVSSLAASSGSSAGVARSVIIRACSPQGGRTHSCRWDYQPRTVTFVLVAVGHPIPDASPANALCRARARSSEDQRWRTMREGLPATTTLAAIQTFVPTTIGRAYSRSRSRSPGSTGWAAAQSCTLLTDDAARARRSRGGRHWRRSAALAGRHGCAEDACPTGRLNECGSPRTAAQIEERAEPAVSVDDDVGEVERPVVVALAHEHRRRDRDRRQDALALELHVTEAADEADLVPVLRAGLVVGLDDQWPFALKSTHDRPAQVPARSDEQTRPRRRPAHDRRRRQARPRTVVAAHRRAETVETVGAHEIDRAAAEARSREARAQ